MSDGVRHRQLVRVVPAVAGQQALAVTDMAVLAREGTMVGLSS